MAGKHRQILLKFFIFVTAIQLGVCSTNVTNSKEEVFKRWVKLRSSAFDSVESAAKFILPQLLSLGYDISISGQCMGSLLKLFNGLRGLKLWAVSMLDASGRVIPGFFAGTVTDLGDYDLCLSLDDQGTSSRKTFVGQYCTVGILPPMPPKPKKIGFHSNYFDISNITNDNEVFDLLSQWLPFFYRTSIRAGVCVPSTCTREDIQELAQTVLRMFIKELDVEVSRCEIKTPHKITREQIIVLSCFGGLLLITFICTLAESLSKRRQPVPHFSRHFRHFSLWSNAARFFAEDQKVSSGRLDVLDGIRWWSMAWIALTHTYGLVKFSALGRLINPTEYLKDIFFGVISSAWVSVDVFFLIGGILVAYATLGQLQRENGRINVIKNIFRRLWRLTPALWAVLGLVFVLPLLGTGPLFNEVVNRQVEICKNTWWLAALYANSWLGHANACLVSTWYVSADLHLYIISPVFIYVFYRNKIFGVIFCILAIIASCVAMFVLNMQYDLYPYVMMMTFNEESTEDVFTTIYFRPYSHVGPYMVGILLGCLLKSNPKCKTKWYLSAMGWCVSTALAMSVLLGPYEWVQGYFPSTPVASLYQSLHKTAFALAVSWVIWASYYGYAGLVSTLLSWSGYRKLCQLVYLIYLVQVPILWLRVGTFRRVMNYEHYNFFVEFLGMFVISALAALVLHLLVESPFISLDSVMFPRPAKNPSSLEARKDNGHTLFSSGENGKHFKNNVGVECLTINRLERNEKN